MEMPVLTAGVQVPEYPGDHFHYVFSKILMAGRANGLQVIDGPYVKVRDSEGFREFCKRSQILGYDALKDEYTDLVKAGVVDPTKVTRYALQNASSISGLLLTTEALVTELPEKEKPAPAGGPGGMGGMGGMDY